jgi:hypothetical protein
MMRRRDFITLLGGGAMAAWPLAAAAQQDDLVRALLMRIMRLQAENAAGQIGQFIKEVESQIGWTTQLPWSAGTIEQRRFDGLRLLRQVPAIRELAQLDSSGKEQMRVSRLAMDVVGSQTDLSQDPKFTEAVAHKVYYGPVYYGPAYLVSRESEHTAPPDYAPVPERDQLSGLGIYVRMEGDLIKVIAPIDEKPAAKAGIMADDIITKLDDEPVQGLTLHQVVEKMRGPANTKIKLTIMRKGHDLPIEVSITRDVIQVSPSVSRDVSSAASRDVSRVVPGSGPYMTLALAGTRRDAGVSVAEVSLKLIWDVILQIKVGKHGLGYLLDAQGRVLVHPDASLAQRDFSGLAQVKAAPAAGTGGATEPVQVARDIHGREVLTARATVAPLGWLVFVEAPVQEADAPVP